MEGATENPGLMNYKFLLAVIHKRFWVKQQTCQWPKLRYDVRTYFKGLNKSTTCSQAGQWEGRNSNPFPSEQKATVVIKAQILMP
jgi:hypothetical protein